MSGKNDILEMAKAARKASYVLGRLATREKNAAILRMAEGIRRDKIRILSANRIDLKAARRKRLKSSFIDRLKLDSKRIKAMIDSLSAVARLKDPVGRIDEVKRRPNGLLVGKIRVPIGVIGIIYESRPNVTSDCAGLCLKSGNAVILKGGSESLNTNMAIYSSLRKALSRSKVPADSVKLITSASREAVSRLLRLQDQVDLIIPRGGEGLIREVARKSLIPVIKHYKGVCHVYVDDEADLNMAHDIAINAKLQRPGVCNAMETLLVHEDVAPRFLPVLASELRGKGVEIRGCPKTRRLVKWAAKAAEKDWYEEYLDLILSVKVVGSVKEAIDHINTYGSRHSDAIVTNDYKNAMMFLKGVDASCVYLNASTRFTDGYEFGKGAEIGISTDKLHARGPMGLEELTTYKYVILGKGQVRR